MGTIGRRQIDPLSEAAARQVALRGATLLVLVSIVMAGAPIERSAPALHAPTHRDARLVCGTDSTQPGVDAPEADEETGAAAAALVPLPRVEFGQTAGLVRPDALGAVIRPPVRVALLDLPPPSAA